MFPLLIVKKHWRPRTKIEWDKIADVMKAAARDMDFVQPSLFDVRISDQLRITLRHHRIRVQTAIF